MHTEITTDYVKTYATEKNLRAALAKLGLDNYTQEANQIPCRYMIFRTPEGRWSAIFFVQEFFSRNRTGGYVGFASQHGFMSV